LRSRQPPLNQFRPGQQSSRGSARSWSDRASWNDMGWARNRCWWMPDTAGSSPLRFGSSKLADTGQRGAASASERDPSLGKSVHGNEEAECKDPDMQLQLHMVKLEFDATEYGSDCLSLSPGELLQHTSDEQNGWVKGRRWPPRSVTGDSDGAAQEGWYPVEFTAPWPDRDCVDAQGPASVGVDPMPDAATVENNLEAATADPHKTPQMEVQVAIGSFDGSQFGKDYMSLSLGDIVEYFGIEEGGWLLGRCINCDSGEVLKNGWYPQGFTQSLPEAAQMAADLAVKQESAAPLQETQAAELELETPGVDGPVPQQSGCSIRWKHVDASNRWERVVDAHADAEGHSVGVVASTGTGALEGVAAVEDVAEEPDAEQPPAPAA